MNNRRLVIDRIKKALAMVLVMSLCLQPLIAYAEGEEFSQTEENAITEAVPAIEEAEPAEDAEVPEESTEDVGISVELATAVADEDVQENEVAQADEIVQADEGVQEDEAVKADEAAQADETVQVDETVQADETVQTDEAVQPEQSEVRTTDNSADNADAASDAEPAVAEPDETTAPSEQESTLMVDDSSFAEDVPSDNPEAKEPQGPSSALFTIDDSELSLRVGQNSVIDELLSKPAKEFNQKLAEICADLSSNAYKKDDVVNNLKELGFGESSISSYNYDKDYAYSFAVKDYQGEDSDGNTKVLVMAARGSSTFRELMADMGSTPSVVYEEFEQKVHTVADNFFKQISANLSGVLQEGTKYKILATGHSLGGAVANLFSAVMMKKGYNDVYCYTFGAIDSIGVETPGQSVTEGYENIHNIYNDFDTFSPTQFGKIAMPGTGKGDGAGQKYGKFGHMDSYQVDHRTEEQKKQEDAVQVYNAVNHSITRYIEDLKDGKVKCVNPSPKPAPVPAPNTVDADDDEEEYDEPEDQDDQEPSEFKPTNRSDAVVLAYEDMYSGESVTSYIMEDDEDFDSSVKELAEYLQVEVVCSGDEPEDLGYALSMNNFVTMQDKQGKTIVMLEIANSSAEDIQLGFDYIIVNGKRISVAGWKSAKVPASRSILISISLSSFVENGNSVSLPLHIYDAQGKELLTAKAVTVTG